MTFSQQAPTVAGFSLPEPPPGAFPTLNPRVAPGDEEGLMQRGAALLMAVHLGHATRRAGAAPCSRSRVWALHRTQPGAAKEANDGPAAQHA